MRTVGHSVGAVALLAVLLTSTAGGAQTGSTSANNGIKLGDGRLHPYFDLELRYDSAAGYLPTLRPELLLHLRPGLRFELPSDTLAINFDGNVDYVWYLGVLSPGSSALSRLHADVGLGAQINRGGQVEVDITDHLMRSDRSANIATTIGILSLYNEAAVAIPLRPGGGALEVTPRGAFGIELFEAAPGSTAPNCASDFACNYTNIRADLDASWKFLPKTALVFDTQFDVRNYALLAGSNAMLLRGMIGLSGLVSPRISVVAKVGWGHELTSNAASTLQAHAEVAYLASETASIRGGYLRELSPVAGARVFGDDRAYLAARGNFMGKLNLHGSAAYDFLTFYGASGRSDGLLTVDVGPDVEITSWFTASAGYILSLRTSTIGAQGTNYTRNEGYLRLRFQY